MNMALQLAENARGQTAPNPLVGAVVVKDGRLVGQGAHLYPGGPHAEVYALQTAGEAARNATVYVTLEPCNHHGRTPPCTQALLNAGVQRVVIANLDPNPHVAGGGTLRLREAGVQVDVGVLAAAARRQNETFFTWAQKSRPFVVWKTALTLDGYIAAISGDSAYVTGPEARASVQELRRQFSAIMVGVGTVLADNPRLTVRPIITDTDVSAAEDTLTLGMLRQPLRVVLDSHLRTPPSAQLLKEPGATRIYTTDMAITTYADRVWDLQQAGAQVVPVATDKTERVDIAQVLTHLAATGVDSLLVEAGTGLASSLFAMGLLDKVVAYVAPKLLGGGRPALKGRDVQRMDEAVELGEVCWQAVGQDLRLEGYPVYPTRPAADCNETAGRQLL
ncbi:bifunctional diaminohydroxyphosphoribosylaminopyrimidine deaminase/5-amino-6-(5-phosphoribosylamino)uracil reductase RibD [Alicyclobacillaceae bacterium I2511]|nr:bifunctional diaminohydroxyphosphoribosylaminopyrimidine deaminase/5-amino-6-(5-phosphoribosylamino)uracil reductase RibD [Alicyclobacillaceae bacterium I2511]